MVWGYNVALYSHLIAGLQGIVGIHTGALRIILTRKAVPRSDLLA